MISLIVFTDKYQGHVWTFCTKWLSLHSNYIQIHNNKDYSWEHKHYMKNEQNEREIVQWMIEYFFRNQFAWNTNSLAIRIS